MPQFDFLINGPLIFSLILTLIIFCTIIFEIFINIIRLQKMRTKIVKLKKINLTEKFLKLKDICFFPRK